MHSARWSRIIFSRGEVLGYDVLSEWSDGRVNLRLTSTKLAAIPLPPETVDRMPQDLQQATKFHYMHKLLMAGDTFTGCSCTELDAIINASSIMTFAEGEEVFTEGEEATHALDKYTQMAIRAHGPFLNVAVAVGRLKYLPRLPIFLRKYRRFHEPAGRPDPPQNC